MATRPTRVLVTGAGGFIGHHLVKDLVQRGYWVRGVDLKSSEYEPSAAHEFVLGDLRRTEDARAACEGIDEVYALAADMGGMGFISAHHAQILHNNSLINLHTLEAARLVIFGEEAGRKHIAELASVVQQGHIVVRVAPGGDSYHVVVVTDADESMRVRSVHGPYRSR